MQFSNEIEESKVSNEDSSLNDEDDENDECNEGPVGPGFKEYRWIKDLPPKNNVEYESPAVI